MPAPLPTDDELARLLRHSLQALPDVPQWASERALRAWRAPEAKAPGLLRRLQAVLHLDSWQPQPGLALRSRAAEASRQMLFAVGEHDVELRISPSPQPQGQARASAALFDISGQVLGPAATGSITWLASGPGGQPLDPAPEGQTDDQGSSGMSQHQADFNELGEFLLQGLPAGPGVLRLRLDADLADLPTIELCNERPAPHSQAQPPLG